MKISSRANEDIFVSQCRYLREPTKISSFFGVQFFVVYSVVLLSSISFCSSACACSLMRMNAFLVR